ncbi:hypothetical protein MMPV_001741 [Pyropia vietnamensis]
MTSAAAVAARRAEEAAEAAGVPPPALPPPVGVGGGVAAGWAAAAAAAAAGGGGGGGGVPPPAGRLLLPTLLPPPRVLPGNEGGGMAVGGGGGGPDGPVSLPAERSAHGWLLPTGRPVPPAAPSAGSTISSGAATPLHGVGSSQRGGGGDGGGGSSGGGSSGDGGGDGRHGWASDGGPLAPGLMRRAITTPGMRLPQPPGGAVAVGEAPTAGVGERGEDARGEPTDHRRLSPRRSAPPTPENYRPFPTSITTGLPPAAAAAAAAMAAASTTATSPRSLSVMPSRVSVSGAAAAAVASAAAARRASVDVPKRPRGPYPGRRHGGGAPPYPPLPDLTTQPYDPAIRWTDDLWVVGHNAVRLELSDLYTMLSALTARHPPRAPTPASPTFRAWWDTFYDLVSAELDLAESVLFTYLEAQDIPLPPALSPPARAALRSTIAGARKRIVWAATVGDLVAGVAAFAVPLLAWFATVEGKRSWGGGGLADAVDAATVGLGGVAEARAALVAAVTARRRARRLADVVLVGRGAGPAARSGWERRHVGRLGGGVGRRRLKAERGGLVAQFVASVGGGAGGGRVGKLAPLW